jgi:hypothetical protein
MKEHYKLLLAQAGLGHDLAFSGLILVLSGLLPMRFLAAIASPRHWIAAISGVCVFLISGWLMLTN